MTETSKGHLVQTVIPKGRIRSLKKEARERMMTVAALVRELIVKHLDRNKNLVEYGVEHDGAASARGTRRAESRS